MKKILMVIIGLVLLAGIVEAKNFSNEVAFKDLLGLSLSELEDYCITATANGWTNQWATLANRYARDRVAPDLDKAEAIYNDPVKMADAHPSQEYRLKAALGKADADAYAQAVIAGFDSSETNKVINSPIAKKAFVSQYVKESKSLSKAERARLAVSYLLNGKITGAEKGGEANLRKTLKRYWNSLPSAERDAFLEAYPSLVVPDGETDAEKLAAMQRIVDDFGSQAAFSHALKKGKK